MTRAPLGRVAPSRRVWSPAVPAEEAAGTAESTGAARLGCAGWVAGRAVRPPRLARRFDLAPVDLGSPPPRRKPSRPPSPSPPPRPPPAPEKPTPPALVEPPRPLDEGDRQVRVDASVLLPRHRHPHVALAVL